MDVNAISHEGLSDLQLFLVVLGNVFLTPLLGLCLYFIWKGDSPVKAAQVGRITVVVSVIVGALTILALLT